MAFKTIAQLFDLRNETAIVSGGSVGIGKSIVDRLSEAGAAVVIADIDIEHGEQTKKEFVDKGRKVEFISTDVSNPDDIEKAVDFSIQKYGSLDILVNNAGIFPITPALDITESAWKRVMDINLKGTFFFSQKAANKMIEKGKSGKIINIASIDAFHPTGNLAHYDASKGGVVMMTRSLALEWGKYGINVNAIAPGGILTPGATQSSAEMIKASAMKAEQITEVGKAFTARIPLGHQGDPDEIATVALFLASGAARYITGETIIADGGYLLS
ncbi:MAG TPA: NAD(P)-dependent oxidoreductase [Anaerolineaceae bacterium]|nr:NAD(P)-dependent oxidoreductase [Anaerolineaceae bacterium]